MFAPEDGLSPPIPVFDEPWQAQALALADGLVRGGHVSADDWAKALGAELARAAAEGQADTTETYYLAVVAALEVTTEAHSGITAQARADRRAAWEDAYRTTPHGKPVTLRTDL